MKTNRMLNPTNQFTHTLGLRYAAKSRKWAKRANKAKNPERKKVYQDAAIIFARASTNFGVMV